MRLIADTHTHTVASCHAYSTILENARAAADAGLKWLGWTDHAPSMPGGPHLWFFGNIGVVPEELYGVRILRGVEADITAGDGALDMTDADLSGLDWVVASIHSPLYPPSTREEHTSAYIGAAKNPHVDVIAHSGFPAHSYDYEKAVQTFAEYGKLLEINEHSFICRQKSIPNCVTLAKLCKQYRCRVVVNTDSHFAGQIGHAPQALEMLEEIGMPECLIVNAGEEQFAQYLEERGKRLRKSGI